MAILPSFILPEEYNLVIIGAGPAGLSSAINLAQHKLNFLLLDREVPMHKIMTYGRVFNYPGLGNTSGRELSDAFVNHLKMLHISAHKELILKITPAEKGYQIFGHEKIYQTKAVIMSIGIIYEKKIPGEEELAGHGVSYCLTCDGLLYAGKKVGVIAEVKEAEAEAVSLQQDYHCQILYYAQYTPAAPLPFEEVHPKALIERLERTDRGVTITLKDHTQEVDGVFIFRHGASPNTLLPEITMKGRHINVDREMKTSLPGLFSAGDCTGPPYQIAKAVGEGQIAALSAINYLRIKK